MTVRENLQSIVSELPQGVRLVAVSKFHPSSDIMAAYDAGQRLFGENRPQEFCAKVKELPEDIEWHFIGHLQTNKLKYVLPYASLVHSIDSLHLLDAVQKWGNENGKVVDALLELHLGAEETKQGLSEEEVRDILSRQGDYPSVRFHGLMGMATNTEDEAVVRSDFGRISRLAEELRTRWPSAMTELSIGMSGDYKIALEYGATIVRVGTKIFGPRQCQQ